MYSNTSPLGVFKSEQYFKNTPLHIVIAIFYPKFFHMQLFHTYLIANDCVRMVWQHQLFSSGICHAHCI